MRIITTAICCAALLSVQAGPSVASEREQKLSPGQPTAEQLGAVSGVISYCSRVDPEHEDRYQRKLKTIFPKLTDDEYERARHTSEFHNAHQSVESVLNQYPRTDGVQACRALL